ncbi:MAG: protein kinase [Nannocystaceae bacterium]
MGTTDDTSSGEQGPTDRSALTRSPVDTGRIAGDTESSLERLVSDKVRQRLFGGPNSTQMIGRYTVIDTVGEGGMGTVLRAFDPQLDRQVALKVLQAQLSQHEAARLRREAQAMAKLSHPNVVQVYEVGSSDGRTFVAMELVSGQTLREWIKEEHDWRECVALFIPLGEGLSAAHECGLVHRDFKPGNALIDAKGRPRVLDFGLARQAEGHDEQTDLDASFSTIRAKVIAEAAYLDTPLTRTGTLMGTPAYMPPEQFDGGIVDARSDQFSFCVTMYEALYGRRPFTHESLEARLEAIRSGELPGPPSARGVPRALHKILRRGLAAEPEARWPSMDALLTELRRVSRPRGQRWMTGGLAAGLLLTSVGLVASRSEPPSPGPEAEGVVVDGDAEAKDQHEPEGVIVDGDAEAKDQREPEGVPADACPDDPSLALCLRFDEVDGRSVRSEAGPAIRGTLQGGAMIGESSYGNALILPGEDGRLVLEPPVDPPGSFSLDLRLWMAPDSPRWAGIIDKWREGPDQGYWLGGTSRPGGLAFWVDGISISIEAVPKERWLHVVGTFDVETGVMSLYIDGELVAMGQHSGPVTPVDQPMVVGWATVDDASFSGMLDSIRIWNRVLEPHER